jgi:hypothetical protein
MAVGRRRRRAKRAIDSRKTSETRGFHEVDGAPCRTAAKAAVALARSDIALIKAARYGRVRTIAVIASDSDAIQTKRPRRTPSLDRFALLAMTTGVPSK